MKRARDTQDNEHDAEELLPNTDPDLDQSAAAERDDEGSAHPQADVETKRLKLQKKLKKLKQTYENRGTISCLFTIPFIGELQRPTSHRLLWRRYHIHQQNTASPGAQAHPIPAVTFDKCHIFSRLCLLLLTEGTLNHLLHLQKPQKLRHMLSQHGEISRLYLAPEGTDCCLLSFSSLAHMPDMCFPYIWSRTSRCKAVSALAIDACIGLWFMFQCGQKTCSCSRCIGSEEKEEDGQEQWKEFHRGLDRV